MSDYDSDIVTWSEHQADVLRRLAAGERVNDQVDWENVVEEIESVGRSERRKLDIAALYADALVALPETMDGVMPQPVESCCSMVLDELLSELPNG